MTTRTEFNREDYTEDHVPSVQIIQPVECRDVNGLNFPNGPAPVAGTSGSPPNGREFRTPKLNSPFKIACRTIRRVVERWALCDQEQSMTLDGYPRTGKLMATIFVAAAAIYPLATALNAQSPAATVGVLTPGLTYEPAFTGLRDGLEKLGYRENREIRFIVEDTKGGIDKLSECALRLVSARPGALFTVATAPAVAAKQATKTIPIVFAIVGDPVQTGLVAGFGSSKNNVTGVVTFGVQLMAKRLEVLKEIAPQTKKVLVIVPTKEPIGMVSLKFLEEGAEKLGLKIVRRDVAHKKEFEQLLRENWAGTADAVFSVPSVLVASMMAAMVQKTKKEHLPLIALDATHTQMGALASYSGDFRDFGIQGAKLLAKILRGAKPADIPIETPDRLLLAINITTAKDIGINIPRKVLSRADRLVE
jgi:putative ABC transport system substrate-binding protein